MHTGDLATMKEQGYVCIAGRNKDMIIRGGENVYPRELEGSFTHPAVADVQIVGIPDERYGEEIVALSVSSRSSGQRAGVVELVQGPHRPFQDAQAFQIRG